MAREPFTCPRCGRRSWHPEDKRQGYCGACHDFTATPATRNEAPDGPAVAGQPAADRLMVAVRTRYRGPFRDGEMPDAHQVALVCRALADHTALEAARTYRRSTDHAGDFHPTSTSIGRWLQDVADQLEERDRSP
ncbi:hypothetical protein QOZ88_05840 [Blastococcus sp. BMG 814]|uniref:Uncharacterized protein n=1 Tax=Blastococcus carthaginiensis TaxID=3050034 RepID=A0ABT9I9B0_9ACTN|nr:hypothetical protein [Blastococcus carthaginiensis]MDP5182151.1 hypothetical protein [Blastococcus carthaginiensis]